MGKQKTSPTSHSLLLRGIGLIGSLLLILPLVTYTVLVYTHATNIPSMDDFTLFLKAAEKLTSDVSAIDKVLWFFGFSNEHHHTIPRYIAVLPYQIFGEVNFRTITLIGSGFWLVFVGIIFLHYRNKYKLTPWLICPLTLMLLSCVDWQNQIWATSSIIWCLGALLVFLHFTLLARATTTSFYFSLLFGILSMWTFGGSIFIIPIGSVFLWLTQKDLRLSIIHLIFFSISLALYFIGYETPANHTSAFDNLTNPIPVSLYFLTFIGNLGGNVQVSIFLGLILIISFLFLLSRKCYEKEPLGCMLFCYLLLNALMAALSRSNFGLEQALVPRYSIITILGLSGFFGCILPYSNNKYGKIAIGLFGGLTFCVYIHSLNTAQTNLHNHRNKLMDGMYLWVINKDSSLLLHPNKDYTRSILATSESKGIYNPDKIDFYNRHRAWKIDQTKPITNKEARASYRVTVDNDKNLVVSGWAHLKGIESHGSEIIVILESHEQLHCYSPFRRNRPDVSDFFQADGLNYDQSGFEAYIEKKDIPPGEYKVGVIVKNRENIGLFFKNDVQPVKINP